MIGIGCWERMGGQVSYSSWLKAFMAENPQYTTTIALGNQTGKTACGAALPDAAWKARTEGNCGELDGAIRDMFGLAASFAPAKEKEDNQHRTVVWYDEYGNINATRFTRTPTKEKDMSKETQTEQKQGDLKALDESIVKYEGLLEHVDFNTGVALDDYTLCMDGCKLCHRHFCTRRKYNYDGACGRCQLISCSKGTAYDLMVQALAEGNKPEFIKQRDVSLATMREAASRLRKELAAEKLEAERKKSGERCVVVAVGMDGYLEVVRNGVHYALCEVVSFADFAGFEYEDGFRSSFPITWRGENGHCTCPLDKKDEIIHPVAVLFK